METLSFKMKSVGEFLKRRSSITNINIAPEYHVQNNKSESSKPQSSQAVVDIREELYDVKKQLAEREKELGEQREMLKDYISNRINISRDLSREDQITRLKKELKKLGWMEPVPARPATPPVSMEEFIGLRMEATNLTGKLQKRETDHKRRIHKIKTKHAEEVAALNLDIFELRDELKTRESNNQFEQPSSAHITGLVIELSTQVNELTAEIEELKEKLARYQD